MPNINENENFNIEIKYCKPALKQLAYELYSCKYDSFTFLIYTTIYKIYEANNKNQLKVITYKLLKECSLSFK